MAAALPIISLVSTIAGGAVSAVGAIQQGNAQAAADRQNADIAQANKVTANQDRMYALETSAADVQDRIDSNRRTSASIKAAFGNSGFDLAGTPLDVLRDTAQTDSVNVLRIQDEGRMQNRKGALAMLGYDMSSSQSLAAANNDQTAGMFNAVGAILNTGAHLTRTA